MDISFCNVDILWCSHVWFHPSGLKVLLSDIHIIIWGIENLLCLYPLFYLILFTKESLEYGSDGYGIFGANANTDIRKQEIIYIYINWVWLSNTWDKDMEWRQDILYFNKRYTKHQSTEQQTLHLSINLKMGCTLPDKLHTYTTLNQ